MAIPVLTLESMRSWEADSWAEGILEEEVIARVGQQIGERIMEATIPGDSVLLLAGMGHNGDDVRAACRWILEREITLINFRDPISQLPYLESALARAPSLVVEGLFGIGLNRPLTGAWESIVGLVNVCNSPTVAIDTPSGLHVDEGKPLGIAIKADQTWTVGAVKTGLLKPDASQFVGRLEVLSDVGLLRLEDVSSPLFYGEASDFAGFQSGRSLESNKGTHGYVMLFAGSSGYHGAAVLAARGATQARPGLVELATHEAVYGPVAAQLQNVMVHPVKKLFLIPAKATSVVIGPGLASKALPQELRAQVVEAWESLPAPVIVDATALDWIPSGRPVTEALRVITPHPGEAARLLGVKASEVQADRPRSLRQLSEKFGNCYVVLKGHQTLVGNSTSRLYVNPSGNPSLAQGGSGDILAGYLGGLLAQQNMASDPLSTLSYGVWAHGHAADECEAHQKMAGFDQFLDKI